MIHECKLHDTTAIAEWMAEDHLDEVKMLEKLLETSRVHPSWVRIICDAFFKLDTEFLHRVLKETYLPRNGRLLNAFSLPVENVRYILFGESPYPREESANGYAFWDASVNEIWSDKGLSKAVNRATSLRNIMKTCLVAEGALQSNDTSQKAIADCDKSNYVKTLSDMFTNLLNQGVLLLNASLTLFPDIPVKKQGAYWQPFINHILESLYDSNIHPTLLLFGKIANDIDNCEVSVNFAKIKTEHPYNLSFIHNPDALRLMKSLSPLQDRSKSTT
jgi:uracil-DNA glycosylase